MNSNTPLQALVLLNDPIYVEAARVFAQNILQAAAAIGTRASTGRSNAPWAARRRQKSAALLTELYTGNLARVPALARGSARELIARGRSAGSQDLQAAELAAMTTVARAILNLHETITRN